MAFKVPLRVMAGPHRRTNVPLKAFIDLGRILGKLGVEESLEPGSIQLVELGFGDVLRRVPCQYGPDEGAGMEASSHGLLRIWMRIRIGITS